MRYRTFVTFVGPSPRAGRSSPSTGTALYPFAAKIGLERRAAQAESPRVDVIPFESEHKFMATLHGSSGGSQVLFAKGAPEVILDHCDRQETKLLFNYAAPLQALFHTEAMPLRLWPPLFLAGLLFFLVVEGEKFILRTRSPSRGAPALAPSGA